VRNDEETRVSGRTSSELLLSQICYATSLLLSAQIEHQQIFLCRSFAGVMIPLMGELQMVPSVLVPQHDTVKSFMADELVEHLKTEPVLVEFNDFDELIRGARYPKMGR